MVDAPVHSRSQSGDGYLAAVGYLQIGAGSLSLMMSLMLVFQVMFGHSELLNPAVAFDSSSDLLDRAIATYVSLQLTVGWLAGALQLAAGVCCLRAKHQRFIGVASLVSLANFPHGTLAAVTVLFALRRPEVAQTFTPRVEN